MWAENPDCIIGKEDTLCCADGHDTNVYNLPLCMAMTENLVTCDVYPSHHTALLQGCDAKAGRCKLYPSLKVLGFKVST